MKWILQTVYTGGDAADGDYHREMNAALFEDWFKSLCSRLNGISKGRKIAIVIDNAPYHSRKLKSVTWFSIAVIPLLLHRQVL